MFGHATAAGAASVSASNPFAAPVNCNDAFDDFAASVLQATNKLKASVSASWHTSRAQKHALSEPLSSSEEHRALRETGSSTISLHVGDNSCETMSSESVVDVDGVAVMDIVEALPFGKNSSGMSSVIVVPSELSEGRRGDARGSNQSLMLETGDQQQELLLRPGWTASYCSNQSFDSLGGCTSRSPSTIKRTTERMGDFGASDPQDVRMGDVFMDTARCRQKFVRHPDKPVSLLHSFCATLMVLYEIVLFPLILAFDMNVSQGPLRRMMWVSTIFWTLDIPCSFLQGFHANGIIEMRLSKVTAHYLRSWFVFDFCIVAIDWGTYVAEFDSGQSDAQGGISSFGRTMRISRFLRAMRVLRIMRLYRELQALATRGGFKASEYVLVLGRLFSLVVLIMFINHYISCVWVGLAIDNAVDRQTWLTNVKLDGVSQAYQYISSLHWSLTQFTPATNDIVPMNQRERLFAVVAVLFGLLMFSTFLSSLTNAVMEINRIRSRRSAEQFKIREFLQRRRVPMDTCMLIWHYYNHNYRVQEIFKHEGDISFFGQMPTTLRQALHMNIYRPILDRHPLFELTADFDKTAILAMCECVNEQFLLRNTEMFVSGELATHMIFLESGELMYDCNSFSTAQYVHSPTFVCEVALWLRWKHCGELTTNMHCEVLLLEAHQFEVRICQLGSSSAILENLRCYAKMYLQAVTNSEKDLKPLRSVGFDVTEVSSAQPLSDLMLDRSKLEQMAETAFGITAVPEVEVELAPKTSRISVVHGLLRSFRMSRQSVKPGCSEGKPRGEQVSVVSRLPSTTSELKSVSSAVTFDLCQCADARHTGNSAISEESADDTPQRMCTTPVVS